MHFESCGLTHGSGKYLFYGRGDGFAQREPIAVERATSARRQIVANASIAKTSPGLEGMAFENVRALSSGGVYFLNAINLFTPMS